MTAEQLILTTLEALKPLYLAYTRAAWDAAVEGTEENNQREKNAQAALMRFWADPERFAAARTLHEDGGFADPLIARQIKKIYLSAAKAQQDEETIQRVTELEAELRRQFYNFRAEVDEKRLSDNDLDDILRKSGSDQAVRTAYLGSKQIGVHTAPQVRQLAEVRNAAAQQQGFRDHFERMLTLNEIEEQQLLDIFAELEEATREPFRSVKTRIDAERAEHFGLSLSQLRPWHYGDRFFQRAPEMSVVDLDAHFSSRDPVALATATYDGLGLEVRPILERSDLYPRPGKNQHAFCIDIDRQGDIRTLNNLQANQRWTETLLHELGHAVYDHYVNRDLPWLLRTPPHTLSTEAIAILMGSLTTDALWLEKILGLSAAEARALEAGAAEIDRAEKLIFTRWCLVMTHFERSLYADPGSDLDARWWDLVEQYQLLQRPDELLGGEWAAKYHIALAPVYYHNYELGYLYSAQVKDRLKQSGGLVGRPEAGRWLIENVFHPGASMDWAAHAALSTGEALNPRYFVEAIA